jgi:hypothetical protein
MAIVVPATDIYASGIQTQIALVQALVNANANPAVLLQNQILLDQLQQNLLTTLMAVNLDRTAGTGNAQNKPSFVSASGLIAAGTINT